MARRPIPSLTQARLLARVWGDLNRHVPVAVDGYVDPTVAACIRHGWLTDSAIRGKYPSGADFIGHEVSMAGQFALADYLRGRA